MKITKRFSLDFLGEQHKDDYLLLESVPMKDYKPLLKQSQGLDEDPVKSIDFITTQVTSRLVEGKVGEEAVTKDNIQDLPGEIFTRAFQELMGMPSPKV